MKKVLIYSPGSFDIEVLQNIILFYSNLGFICSICYGRIQKKYKVSRFIYLRDSIEENYLNMVDSEICDVFDYSKTIDDNSLFCISNYFNTVNYISLTKPLIDIKFNYIKAYHPVVTNLWVKQIVKKDIGLIYIGSRKSSIRLNEDDIIYKEFENLLFNKYRNGDISVFGNGWIGLDRRISKLNMSKVALFYSNSKSALGVLWDIQRYKTLNSRYFYAPLNGCLLFCEENSNLLDVPGVFGYSEMLNKLDNFGIEQSKDLQSKAIAFWNNENKNLISQLSLREKSLFFIGLYNNILSFFINSYFKFK